jgi:hypothetical protein
MAEKPSYGTLDIQRPSAFKDHAALAASIVGGPTQYVDLHMSQPADIQSWIDTQRSKGGQFFFIEPGMYGDAISLGNDPKNYARLNNYMQDNPDIAVPGISVPAEPPAVIYADGSPAQSTDAATSPMNQPSAADKAVIASRPKPTMADANDAMDTVKTGINKAGKAIDGFFKQFTPPR